MKLQLGRLQQFNNPVMKTITICRGAVFLKTTTSALYTSFSSFTAAQTAAENEPEVVTVLHITLTEAVTSAGR